MSIYHREHTEAPGFFSALVALKNRFVVKLRNLGPGFLAMRLLHRLTPDFLFTMSDTIYVASDIPAAAASDTPDPELRWANDADMDIIAASVPRAKVMREKFGDHSIVAVIMAEGEVVALEWFVTAPRDCGSSWVHPMLEGGGWLQFRLPREDVWSIWSWVDPSHRGKRLMVRCQSFANIRLAKEKYSCTWGGIYSGNEWAIRAHSKRGYRPVSRVAHARILGLTFLWIDGALKIGLSSENHPYEIDTRELIAREQPGAKINAETAARYP